METKIKKSMIQVCAVRRYGRGTDIVHKLYPLTYLKFEIVRE